MPVIVFSSHSTEGAVGHHESAGAGSIRFRHQAERCHGAHGGDRKGTDCEGEGRGRVQAEAAHADGRSTEAGEVAGIVGAPTKLSRSEFPLEGRRLWIRSVATAGDFPGAIIVVQHMPDGFTDMFARRLDEVCPLRVKEAQSGDVLQPGRVLICPGSRHMKVKRLPLGDVVVLGDEPG